MLPDPRCLPRRWAFGFPSELSPGRHGSAGAAAAPWPHHRAVRPAPASSPGSGLWASARPAERQRACCRSQPHRLAAYSSRRPPSLGREPEVQNPGTGGARPPLTAPGRGPPTSSRPGVSGAPWPHRAVSASVSTSPLPCVSPPLRPLRRTGRVSSDSGPTRDQDDLISSLTLIHRPRSHKVTFWVPSGRVWRGTLCSRPRPRHVADRVPGGRAWDRLSVETCSALFHRTPAPWDLGAPDLGLPRPGRN